MIFLNKKEAQKEFMNEKQILASVCSSCACGGGVGSCNTTCKGCKDKNENVSMVRNIYGK